MAAIKIISRANCDAACQQAAAELDLAKFNVKFYDQRRRSLLARYPDQWVAIANGKLVGHHSDLDKLVGNLQRRGIDPRTSFVQFISKKKRPYVL